MPNDPRPPGPLQAAVEAHNPSQAVLYEARALERELGRVDRSWDAILPGIASFVDNYASILLHEPSALAALGQGCLDGVDHAPAVAQRARAASLLIGLLGAVSVEVQREGIDRIDRAIPTQMRTLVAELAERRPLPFDRGRLVPPMLDLGQQLVMMADEGAPPQLWFELLAEVNGLLLSITRQRVAGEPTYDGRWDAGPAAEQLDPSALDTVRVERIQADLDWLAGLDRTSGSGERSSAEVYLDLQSYESRDERQRCWQDWFERVAARAEAGAIDAGVLRQLCEGLADWIAGVEDRAFLAALAGILAEHVPTVVAGAGPRAGEVALETFGLAVAVRLEREAGRGETDLALESLRRLGAELVEVAVGDGQSARPEALALGYRVRTGPVTGQPASAEDVMFRLGLAEKLGPAEAARTLLGLVVGFRLEQVHLSQTGSSPPGHSPVDQARRMVESLAGLLGRQWPDELIWIVRTLLRAAPISPVELAGTSCRAHLIAMAPGDRKASYLHDLKARILGAPGSDNLGDIERVLGFWLDGRAERLDGLATPDSLAALALSEVRDQQIRRLLENLTAHVPVADAQGVRWLARLPTTLTDPDNLAKVAGFDGLAPEAASVLASLVCIYQILVQRYRPAGQPRLTELGDTALQDRADELLAQRAREHEMLFGSDGMAELTAFERLERFGRELALVRELDGVLEELALRWLARTEDGDEPASPAAVLGRMLTHAALSGLAPSSFGRAGEDLLGGRTGAGPGPMVAGLLQDLAALRDRLRADLRPHVIDSVRRLHSNPLAAPSATYRHWLAEHRELPEDEIVDGLVAILVDNLLAGDGGGLMLEEYLKRLTG